MSTPRGPWDEPPRRRSRDPLPPELDPRGRRNAPPPGRRPPPDPRRGPARPAYGNEWGDRAGWDRDDRPDYGPPARSGGGPGGRPPVRPGPFDEGPRRRGRVAVVAGQRGGGGVMYIQGVVDHGQILCL